MQTKRYKETLRVDVGISVRHTILGVKSLLFVSSNFVGRNSFGETRLRVISGLYA